MNQLYSLNSQSSCIIPRLYITLLAGGMGNRMKSDLPKVLHKVKGEAMLVRLIKQVLILNPDKLFVVVGKFRSIIEAEILKHIDSNKIVYVDQNQPLGTGDAVKCTLGHFDSNTNIINIILNGDVPLIHYSTIKEIYDYFINHKSKLLITSIHLQNPSGNGRIIIDEYDNFKEIVEEKDCKPEQKSITLVNCGIYICDSSVLTEYIPKIKSNNAQGEYYLTDLVKIYRNANVNHNIDLFTLSSDKEIEIYNVNTKEQLDFLENKSFPQ